MRTLSELGIVVRRTLDEWVRLSWSDLHFAQARTAWLVFAVTIGIAFLMLLARHLRSRRAERTHVTVPAILPAIPRSALSATRHASLVIFLLGVPFFAVALADPHTSFTREELSYPGRRIALLVDASTSMTMTFASRSLRTRGNPAFFTAVAAAEHFVRQRMRGPYHDLIALLEFGNEAYVVTPFTTDYDNILLSLGLISDPREWGRFDDWGTTILQGIDQGTQLFKTFDFLNAAGNLMIVFTDGRDDQATLKGRRLDELVTEARRYKIPIYMIRIAYNMELGKVAQDVLWKPAIERTGGRFYAAADEATILRAENEIDRLSAGRIDVHEYTVDRPRFAGFTLIAVALWLLAAALKLGVPHFRTFP
jgi:hypothetical protein